MRKLKIFGILAVLVFVLGACSAVDASEDVVEDEFAELGIRINEINTAIETLEAEFDHRPDRLFVDYVALEANYAESRELLERIIELQHDLLEYNLEFPLPRFLAHIQLRDRIEEWRYEDSQFFEDFYSRLMWAVQDLRLGGGMGLQHFMVENRDLFPDYCLMEAGWLCDGGLKDVTEHEVFKRLTYW